MKHDTSCNRKGSGNVLELHGWNSFNDVKIVFFFKWKTTLSSNTFVNQRWKNELHSLGITFCEEGDNVSYNIVCIF